MVSVTKLFLDIVNKVMQMHNVRDSELAQERKNGQKELHAELVGCPRDYFAKGHEEVSRTD